MKADIKEKWIAALESGKYKQTSMQLKTDDGFCCLGVLCDLHAQETNSKWSHDLSTDLNVRVPVMQHHYFGEHETLPQAVMDWAGLEHGNPVIIIGDPAEVDDMESMTYQTNLAEENDLGRSFVSIAHIIDTQL